MPIPTRATCTQYLVDPQATICQRQVLGLTVSVGGRLIEAEKNACLLCMPVLTLPQMVCRRPACSHQAYDSPDWDPATLQRCRGLR